MRRVVLTALLAALCGPASAQFEGRRYVRQGNREFERGNYVEAEIAYRRSLEKAPTPEGAFNLAGAMFKEEQYEQAAQMFNSLAASEGLSPQIASQAYYGGGNAQLKQRKLDEAIESYKNALRIDPGDQQAKFNLAYAKKLKDDQNKDQDKDQDKDQNKDQQNQDQKPQPDQGQDQEQPQKPQPRPGSLTPEQAEQMLEAMQQSEDKTRDKMDEEKKAAVAKSLKNW